MSERIDYLRDRFFEAPRAADTERAVLVTESYQANEDKSDPMKRALALGHIMKHMHIAINPRELIVGCHTQKVRAVPLFPEYAAGWIATQMDDFPTRPGDQFAITEEQKKTVRECLKYWSGRALDEKVNECIPPELQKILDYNVVYNASYQSKSPGHLVPDYEYLLANGLEHIIRVCEEKMNALSMLENDYVDKREFYRGSIEAMKAVIAYAQRFSDLAGQMAATEEDPARKEELLTISRNCARVPAKSATGYWEALQFVYFIQLAIQLEGNGLAISIGRMDKFLYPYYEMDRKKGNMNHEQALELMSCLYLKLSEIDKISSNQSTAVNTGPAHGQTITIGGTWADGTDVANDISLIVLEADRQVHLAQPDIAVRIHEHSSDRFLEEVTQNVKMGLNKVKIYNDALITQSLKDVGVSDEDAYDFSFLGCSEPVISGKTNSWGNSGHINLAKCLELALNDGKCMLTGEQFGPHTGNAEEFTSIDDVKEAYRTQVNYFTDVLVKYDRIIDMCHRKYLSLPFCSVTIDGCVERGLDFENGGAIYNFASPLGVGPITVGDSLMAMKKFVFDEKKLTMKQLLEALRTDFVGQEPLRLMLKNRAPKYGNDLDEPDEMSNFAVEVLCDALEGYKTARGGLFTAGIYYMTANVPNGKRTAATPNGRHAYEPLNDGGVSPTHGDDRSGATAIFKSAGKLCNVRAGHGSVLNQLLHPSIFKGEGSDKVFCNYMKSILDCGVWETQFNVITHEELKKAQENPEEYRGLVVRVAGYSAFFTILGKEVQDDIIDRTSLNGY